MGLLISVSFISGILTIFSPCIWPILPVVLSSSLNKSTLYSLSLTFGIITALIALMLGFSYLARIFQLNIEFFRTLSFSIIFVSGLIMIFPQLQNLFDSIFKITKTSALEKETTKVNWLTGFVTGISLGVLWTPCAGPILITIAMLAANQIVNASTILVLISYASGVAFPIFMVVLAEQWIVNHHYRLTKLTRITQILAGIIVIISVVLIYTHYDKILWAKIAPSLPFVQNNITQLEEIKSVKKELEILKQKQGTKLKIIIPTSIPTPNTTIYILPSSTPSPIYPKAPEISGIIKWFNTENNSPVFLEQLRGKTVLLEFWTYTCVPCIPTIDFFKQLQQKYQDKGLVIVSIHTPGYVEARLEKNVKAAIDRYAITYPVAMDNDWKTFDAYKNNYWPTEFLIDKNGYIRFHHEGGGENEKIEQAVVNLLEEVKR
jgi:cytochrome c biogenesis protein CcdA/thiol-disulfide isomerase/thioredoxin